MINVPDVALDLRQIIELHSGALQSYGALKRVSDQMNESQLRRLASFTRLV